jgi:D-arabinose 1-dehydrogenase-like Zn-dependent alcohol dehydrogenase
MPIFIEYCKECPHCNKNEKHPHCKHPEIIKKTCKGTMIKPIPLDDYQECITLSWCPLEQKE